MREDARRRPDGGAPVVRAQRRALELGEMEGNDPLDAVRGQGETVAHIDAVPHGFRASFRTWAAETRVDFDVAETCLAHAVGTHVFRLYGRTDLFDARVRSRCSRQRWNNHLLVVRFSSGGGHGAPQRDPQGDHTDCATGGAHGSYDLYLGLESDHDVTIEQRRILGSSKW